MDSHRDWKHQKLKRQDKEGCRTLNDHKTRQKRSLETDVQFQFFRLEEPIKFVDRYVSEQLTKLLDLSHVQILDWSLTALLKQYEIECCSDEKPDSVSFSVTN